MFFLKFFSKFKIHGTKKPDQAQNQAHDESRLWLMKTMDILPKPFFLLDYENNKISFSNAAARKMMGLDYSQHVSKEIHGVDFFLYDLNGNLVPADTLPSVRTLRGETVQGEEFLLVTKAGRFNIKVYSEKIPSMYEQPEAGLIIFEDITELKTTENNLRQAQADLNEAIEIAQVGFWNFDTINKNASLNNQLMKQFDVHPDEFNGNLDIALAKIHEEDRSRVVSAIEKSISDGSSYHIEHRVVHSNGSVRWIEAKSGVKNDPAAHSNRFSGTTIDITEKVTVRQGLEANEKELRLLADSMPQIVWNANSKGELDYFNQVWFDYSGSDYNQSAGNGWVQFVHPEDLHHTIENWKEALEHCSHYENEFRLRDKSGNYRWHVARAIPISESATGLKAKV